MLWTRREDREPMVSNDAGYELEPVIGADGAITDVRISYSQDFMAQMLEWAGKR